MQNKKIVKLSLSKGAEISVEAGANLIKKKFGVNLNDKTPGEVFGSFI